MAEGLRVTVFGSSSPRTPAAYLAAAAALGRGLAAAGHHCVNGAGKDGCMGALIDAVLAAGGRVDGVILRVFLEQGHGHQALVERLVVTETMRERKRRLGEGAHAFVVLPGGPGTWEELWEVAVERQIGSHRCPLIVIDVDGCYAGLRQQLARAHADGLLYGEPEELMTMVDDVPAALTALAAISAEPGFPK